MTESSVQKRRLCVLALLVLGWALPGDAATVIRLSNEELTKRAEIILHGRCTDQVAQPASGSVVTTEYTFSVVEVLKGPDALKGATTFKFKSLGGTLDDGRRFAILGFPTYGHDEEMVLFLEPEHPKTGCRIAVGLGQGKFTVQEDPSTHAKNVVRDLGGLEFVDAHGKPVNVEKSESGLRISLDALMTEIKGYLQKQKN